MLIGIPKSKFSIVKFSVLEISLDITFGQYYEKNSRTIRWLVHIVIYLSAETHAIKNHLKLVREYYFIQGW